MPDVYEIEVGGQVYEVEAGSLEQAATAAKSFVGQSVEGAAPSVPAEPTAPEAAPSLLERWGQMQTMRRTGGASPEMAREIGLNKAATLSAAGVAAAPIGVSAVTAPVATAASTGLGLVGAATGEEVGNWTGQHLPLVGGETAAHILGTIGGIVGGGYTAIKGPGAILDFAKHAPGKLGIVARLLAPETETALKGAGAKAFNTKLEEAASKAAAKLEGAAPKAAAKLEGSVVKMEPTRTLVEAETRHVSSSAAPSADKAFLEFAKKEGPNFKRGERVWFVKDASGKPIKTFESGAQADGWMRRKENRGAGYAKDFFQNLWAS